jgi:hypothetical protein
LKIYTRPATPRPETNMVPDFWRYGFQQGFSFVVYRDRYSKGNRFVSVGADNNQQLTP